MSGNQRGRGGGSRGDYQGGGRGGHGGGSRGDFQGGGRGGRGGGPAGSQQMPYRPGGSSNAPAANVPIVYRPPGAAVVPVPNPEVTKAENKNVLAKIKRPDHEFPLRPGYGTKGKPTVLYTNYFAIEVADNAPTGYRYAVSVTGELSKPKRRLLMQLVLARVKAMLPNAKAASNFADTIITTQKLDLGLSGEWLDEIDVAKPESGLLPAADASDSGQQQARARRLKQFRVILNGTFSLADLVDYARAPATSPNFVIKEDLVQVFNIMIGTAPNETPSVYKVGSENKFYLHGSPLADTFNLGGGLEGVRGYYASVRVATARILVNLNVTSGAFYKPLPLKTLVVEVCGNPAQNTAKMLEYVRMLKVETNYMFARDDKGNPKKVNGKVLTIRKKKTIVGLAPKPPNGSAKTVKFMFRDPNKPGVSTITTVNDYFHAQYGIKLQYPDWPVLNVGTRADPQYLPIELCTVLAGQPFRRMLAGNHTSEMIKFAARPPAENAMSIATKGVQMYGIDSATTLVSAWFIKLDCYDMC